MAANLKASLDGTKSHETAPNPEKWTQGRLGPWRFPLCVRRNHEIPIPSRRVD